MSTEIPTDPLQLFIYIALGGSIIAGIFEWIRYYLNKRREEYIELSKHRMEVISKFSPHLFNLGTYSLRISKELSKNKNKRDLMILLFYLCCLLHARHRIFILVGGIKLDSIESEEVIVNFINELVSFFRDHLGLENINLMQKLVDGNDDFHKFKNSTIVKYKDLPQEFFSFMNNLQENQVKDLIKTCQWLFDIIDFEMYCVDKLWYGKFPKTSFNQELRDYLKSNNADYFKKIHHLEMNPIKRSFWNIFRWST